MSNKQTYLCWNGSDGSDSSDAKSYQEHDAEDAAIAFGQDEWSDSAGEVGTEFDVMVQCPDEHLERWTVSIDFSPDVSARKAKDRPAPPPPEPGKGEA